MVKTNRTELIYILILSSVHSSDRSLSSSCVHSATATHCTQGALCWTHLLGTSGSIVCKHCVHQLLNSNLLCLRNKRDLLTCVSLRDQRSTGAHATPKPKVRTQESGTKAQGWAKFACRVGLWMQLFRWSDLVPPCKCPNTNTHSKQNNATVLAFHALQAAADRALNSKERKRSFFMITALREQNPQFQPELGYHQEIWMAVQCAWGQERPDGLSILRRKHCAFLFSGSLNSVANS